MARNLEFVSSVFAGTDGISEGISKNGKPFYFVDVVTEQEVERVHTLTSNALSKDEVIAKLNELKLKKKRGK